MRGIPRKSVVFRDGRSWRGGLAGLKAEHLGALELSLFKVPAPVEAITPAKETTSFSIDLFPLAVGPSGWVAYAGRKREGLTLVDGSCEGARWSWSPRDCDADPAEPQIVAVAVSRRRLAVAFGVDRSVRLLALPRLEEMAHVPSEISATALGFDALERLYVLDRDKSTLRRLGLTGNIDGQYGLDDVRLGAAHSMAVGPDGTVFLARDDAAEILVVSVDGKTISLIPPPEKLATFSPGAVTIAPDSKRMFVADRAAGRIWVRDVTADVWLDTIPRFRGAVHGLGADACGRLFVWRPDQSAPERLEPTATFGGRGELSEGPLDAGSLCRWLRVHVEADLAPNTSVRLWTFVGGSPVLPAAAVFQLAKSLDTLVVDPAPPDRPPSDSERFLWIRVELSSSDPSVTPRLSQIVAETEAESYLERLPAVYAREDAPTGFLRAWLEVMRAEFGDLEAELSTLQRNLQPATAPEALLPWLASWIACDLPEAADEAKRRALLLSAHERYARRGTLRGLREAVLIETGIECEIIESFRSRHLWALNGTARLGLDTGLLPALPDGMVVPGPSLPETSLQGLLEEYFLDDSLGTSAAKPDSGGDRCEPFFTDLPLIETDGGFSSFNKTCPAAGKASGQNNGSRQM
jgi:phage tail-like protein